MRTIHFTITFSISGSMDELTIKTPNPISRLFFKICGIVFNRFYRLEIYTGDLLSDLPPPFPKLNVQYIQTVCLGRGLSCTPYSAGFLHSVSDQIQNLQNCYTTPNKMTSEDDIKGLVSLKFLRPCQDPIPLWRWNLWPQGNCIPPVTHTVFYTVARPPQMHNFSFFIRRQAFASVSVIRMGGGGGGTVLL